MKHLHSTLAIIVLAALIIVIVITLLNLIGKKPFNRKVALIGLITAHLQGLVGIVLYFTSALGFASISAGNMKVSSARFYFLEHPLMMIIAAVLVTIGYSKSKKMIDDHKANRTVVIFYVIALILILSRIPMPISSWSIFNG